MVSSIDPEKVAGIIRECGQTIVLPYHNNLESHQVARKNDATNSVVTIADQEAEAFLTEKLRAMIPGSFVVGEEATEDDPSLLDHLSDPDKAVWVIDPVDGTGNFESGSKTFCIIVALVTGGKTQMGWIYDVCNDSMAFAQNGKGAYIDGQKAVIPAEAQDRKRGYVSIGHRVDTEDYKTAALRCSGLEYVRIAKGEGAFSVYGFTKPWDHLAGTLLVKEAGGIVRRWDHTDYLPGDGKKGLISAANEDIWAKMRSFIPEKTLQKYNIEP